MEWEYKIVQLGGGGVFGDPDVPTESALNELGGEGWELAASLVGSGMKIGGRGGSTTGLVFKRPVDSDTSRGEATGAGSGQ